MAKGLEDTLFYRYMPLLSLNEVGGDPSRFGVSVREFHRANLERVRLAPNALIATATHDTKRGEDFRPRLHALSELPDEWSEILELWKDLTSTSPADGVEVPDPGERYLILQSILGAWPVALLGSNAEDGTLAEFGNALRLTSSKPCAKPNAIRVGFARTSATKAWRSPSSAISLLLRSFLTAFRPFARRLAYLGMLSSLLPDGPQRDRAGRAGLLSGDRDVGSVAGRPDNRRPVDYERRNTELSSSEPIGELFGRWTDGRIKQRLIRHLLADRSASPELYAFGDYQPLTVTGPRSAHVLAFMRSFSDERLVVVVPRLFAALVPDEHAPLPTRGRVRGSRFSPVNGETL